MALATVVVWNGARMLTNLGLIGHFGALKREGLSLSWEGCAEICRPLQGCHFLEILWQLEREHEALLQGALGNAANAYIHVLA